MLINRREFVRGAVAATGGLAIHSCLAGAVRAFDGAGPRPIGPPVAAGAVQQFVDLERVDTLENATRSFHSVEKYAGNPVIGRVEPWENDRSTWGSVIYDEQEKVFKAWYGGLSGRKTEFRPGSTTECSVLCYATSTDGIQWERPRLGLCEVLGTRENNVIIGDDYHDGMAHWESFVKDPLESNPQRLYKAVGWSSYDWDGAKSGIYTATSPDGLHWTNTPDPVFHHRRKHVVNGMRAVGDAHTLMIDTVRKRYVTFLRAQPNRLFSVSEDFVRWSSPAMSLEARPGETTNTLNNHLGFVYGDRYLGQLSYLNHTDPTKTLMEVWLMSSRDGGHWDRHDTGAPFIGAGPIGDWDRFTVRLSGAPPIRVGDRLFFYYRSSAGRHGPYVGTDTGEVGGGLGLATLRVDGFASVASGYDGGRLTTHPLVFEGKALRVNTKANFGRLAAEVLDERGQPIPNYTLADCVPLTLDSVDAGMRWKERQGLEEFADRPIRLRFHLTNARLYAYRVA